MACLQGSHPVHSRLFAGTTPLDIIICLIRPTLSDGVNKHCEGFFTAIGID
jgi:hypothetical protein